MARMGPEDNMVVIQGATRNPKYVSASAGIHHYLVHRTPREGSQVTAPDVFSIVRLSGPAASYQPSELYYRDGEEADRFTAIARSKGPSGQIIRDLATSRNNCMKASYMHHVRVVCTAVVLRPHFTFGPHSSA